MAVDRSRLKARAAAGDAAAKRALDITRRTSFMLSGAQLGITVTALLVGFVAEPLIGSALGEGLGGVGVPTGVGIAVGTVLALAFSTFVHMIFGELFPKNLAIARPEPLARWLSTSTRMYLATFGWLIHIFDQASNLLLRAVRIEPVHDVEHSATVRDLEHIVAESRDTGDLPAELSMLLDRVLDFPARDVEHAMIPRTRVDIVRTDDSVGHVRGLMRAGHSRYPVLSEDDDIVGVVHLQDMLDTDETEVGDLSTITRPALLVPTTMPLPEALRLFIRSRNEMAVVVDEYGGLAGVVTLEDLAEELVGEIADEHDPDESVPSVETSADGTWTMAGSVPVDEAERSLDCDLPRGDYETLAGLVIAGLGRLPTVGSRVAIELPLDPAQLALDTPPSPATLHVEVLEIERHVPSLMRLTLQEGAEAAP
jgi:CBS domain containing-hemolysin-like protein